MGNPNTHGSSTHPMGFALRPMEVQDIPQVAAVERNAFPETSPPTSWGREIKNSLARYLVAWEPLPPGQETPPSHADANSRAPSFWPRLIRRLLGDRAPAVPSTPAPTQHVVGYVGTWFMTDEAHIVSIGVLETYRRRGVGELLLMGAIELALSRGSRVLTLEVRVGNLAAQALYIKYGFKVTGQRRRYYSDNGEDAFIMSTSPINTSEFRQRLSALIQAHQERYGASVRALTSPVP